jgi:hypothetical protein
MGHDDNNTMEKTGQRGKNARKEQLGQETQRDQKTITGQLWQYGWGRTSGT